MHFVIVLLAAITFFLYLTMGVAKDPEKRKFFIVYLLVDTWLIIVFVYLLVSALSD
ncbi:MAG: hypothetical protein ACERLB_15545 [Gammaproteobacteria bacterium]